VHSWFAMCLPSVPQRVTEDHCTLYYRSSFLGTQLCCYYQRGEASIHSDSLSSITIIKEIITKQATLSKTQLSISFEFNKGSVFRCLDLLRPKIEYHAGLASKHEKIPALQAICSHEGDARDFLSEEYIDILDRVEEIEREYKSAPEHLEFLHRIVVDLFNDMHKLQGQHDGRKVMALKEKLVAFNYREIVALFSECL
jgi:Bardet-Biedl syndrome 7 protein